MPRFSVHRMKDAPRQSFRWAPHTSGVSAIKPRDFEPSGDVEAASYYDAWLNLRGTERALEIGDVLESDAGEVRICKYVGFEEARWVLPEVKSGLESLPILAGAAAADPAPAHA